MSIPKIIHYCWFGGGPINPESRKCIESWKKYCPDYKIIEWNEQNFEISQNRYAQQAYEAKKYAFVSDYVRLAVLYEYGGIYLDTDVELVRPLDELLEHKGFIGMEHSAPSPYGRTLLVNTGSGVGAEPGCEMIGKMLAAYRNAAFVQETGEPDLRTCTQRDTPLFTKAGLQQKDEQQELDGFLVLPTDCRTRTVTRPSMPSTRAVRRLLRRDFILRRSFCGRSKKRASTLLTLPCMLVSARSARSRWTIF